MQTTWHASWHGLDRAALDRAYNARDSVPDYDGELRRYATLSADARLSLAPTTDLVFDPATGLALDWFHGAPSAPAVLWIHGGYWRALSKQDQSLVAPGLVAAGIHVAVMDYQLAPAVDLDTIVQQVRTALAWLADHAADQGADPTRLFVAGHSAGGHLVGMALASGWDRPAGLQGGIAVSGLFDLEPIRRSYINEWLQLDPEAVARLSPIGHLPPAPAPRLLATYGGLESSEFHWQTDHYARAYGERAEVVVQAERHHFDLVVALGAAGDPLCRAATDFVLGR